MTRSIIKSQVIEDIQNDKHFVKKPKAAVIEKKIIVIVGSSFSGRMIAEELLKIDNRNKYIQILMIDKKNHFEFNPNSFQYLTEP